MFIDFSKIKILAGQGIQLFGYVIVFFGILTTPFWAAYNQHDFKWIVKVTNKLLKIWVFVTLGVLLLIGISGYIYHI